MLRNLMLWAASNRAVQNGFAWIGRKSRLTRRFIAGESLEEAVPVVRELQAAGLAITLDLLGEGVRREEEAVRARDAYINLLHSIHSGKVNATISIKPTQLGLDIDLPFCEANLRSILETATRLDNFVRIDMESSAYTQNTLDVFKRSFREFGAERVGIVIQAYLYRSEQDVRELSGMGCNIRLCKGAYMEPASVAYPRKRDVDASFMRLTDIMLKSPGFSAIATHDDRMIRHACEAVEASGLAHDRFEFQMLFGVRRDRQVELRQAGYRMKVYVPFGTQWAPYFIRRLAERPANLLFIARNLVRK